MKRSDIVKRFSDFKDELLEMIQEEKEQGNKIDEDGVEQVEKKGAPADEPLEPAKDGPVAKEPEKKESPEVKPDAPVAGKEKTDPMGQIAEGKGTKKGEQVSFKESAKMKRIQKQLKESVSRRQAADIAETILDGFRQLDSLEADAVDDMFGLTDSQDYLFFNEMDMQIGLWFEGKNDPMARQWNKLLRGIYATATDYFENRENMVSNHSIRDSKVVGQVIQVILDHAE